MNLAKVEREVSCSPAIEIKVQKNVKLRSKFSGTKAAFGFFIK